jgi:hypothetical protein
VEENSHGSEGAHSENTTRCGPLPKIVTEFGIESVEGGKEGSNGHSNKRSMCGRVSCGTPQLQGAFLAQGIPVRAPFHKKITVLDSDSPCFDNPPLKGTSSARRTAA